METLPGSLAIGHVRYSTAGSKGATAIRDVQPFFGEFSMGGAAIAHNGNLTNAAALRRELIERGSIFQSSSDSRMHHPPDGALDPEEHLRTHQGRAAPRRRRVFRRRHDPHQADRRARPPGRAPARAGPHLRQRLGAGVGNLRARHHRRRVHPRDRTRRDGGDRKRQGQLDPALHPGQIALLHLRARLFLAPRLDPRRSLGLRDPSPDRRRTRPRSPGRGRPRLPGARLRHPRRHRLQPAKRHSLRHGHHPQPVHGPHLHRADRNRSATWACASSSTSTAR